MKMPTLLISLMSSPWKLNSVFFSRSASRIDLTCVATTDNTYTRAYKHKGIFGYTLA